MKIRYGLPALLGLLLSASPVWGKATAEQAAKLGGAQLNCIGAERAGSASGVAAYTGKWLETWPGMKPAPAYDAGPYAAEKPLFTITADNRAQYAAHLSEGQMALLQKYPKTFRMPVYPSHRDFRPPDWACAVAKQNATSAELVHDGLGIAATAGEIPFPFAANGLEAIWNVLATRHVWNETAMLDIADVFANGNITWGKQRYLTLSPSGDPKQHGSTQETVGAYFNVETLAPAREKGKIGIGFQPNDFKDGSTRVWEYNPGTRRLRQAPDVAFDYAVPPSGLRTVDDDSLFNGSPERYNWKLLGRKEIYVPYNNFRIDDPSIKYAQLLTPNTINPDYERYELHRVWMIEATLKPGLRHVYARRVLYADEDSWLALWADNFDSRGQLYRSAFVNFRYAPEAQAFHRGVSVYHDLSADAYEAGYLVNEAGERGWKLNRSDVTPQMFSPNSALRSGH
ncbi:MAG: hypothetical protein JWR16_1852 [Nevskia sp.]|nr:hypothetical protein [Nevskia sp.]